MGMDLLAHEFSPYKCVLTTFHYRMIYGVDRSICKQVTSRPPKSARVITSARLFSYLGRKECFKQNTKDQNKTQGEHLRILSVAWGPGAEFQKNCILGSRIPDIILKRHRHFYQFVPNKSEFG